MRKSNVRDKLQWNVYFYLDPVLFYAHLSGPPIEMAEQKYSKFVLGSFKKWNNLVEI